MFSYVAGGLSAGFASAFKYTEKPVSVEKTVNMKDALKDRMKKVCADLRKDGKIPKIRFGTVLYTTSMNGDNEVVHYK